MKSKTLAIACGCALTLVLGTPGVSQNLTTLPTRSEIESDDWVTRRDAFARIVGLEPARYSDQGVGDVARVLQRTIERDQARADARKLILIDLLRVEEGIANEKRREALAGTLPNAERLSEEYVNYYGDVIAAVSSLRDPRSIEALLGVITTGNMAVDALVSFGSVAIAPVAALLESSDSGVRSAAALTLVRMLEHAPNAADQPLIRESMTRAAADPDPFVRIRAVQGLAALGGDDSLALVEAIARSDPYQADHREGRPYIVREAATQALHSRAPE